MSPKVKIAEVVVEAGNILGETPVWCAEERALYWVDIRGPAIHRYMPATWQHHSWPMPDLCGAIVPAEGGGLIVAFRSEIAHFDAESGRVHRLAEIEPPGVDNRLNEAKCDRAGRLWIGSMRDFGAAIEGSLYCVGPDLKPKRILSDIRIPNSLGWSPDSSTMYFADTGELALMRYPYDPASGMPGDGAILIDPSVPGRPDGCAIDSEGYVWNARFGTGEVIRVNPAGEIVDTVKVKGTLQVTSCTLGGPDLKTLYITTAKQKLDAEALAQQPNAGDLFAARVETAGLHEPAFRFDRTVLA